MIRAKPPQIPVLPDEVPAFRTTWAIEMGRQKNMLLQTWGGIGDQICAEPTLRWATEGGGLRNNRVTLASGLPELFSHLPFDDVYDTRKDIPVWDDYLMFQMMVNTESLCYQFMSHMIINCVDYPSLCSFRFTLPIDQKNVVLKPKTPANPELMCLAENASQYVGIHAGKHWESKTYPVEWWNAVLDSIKKSGLTPILLGSAKTEHGGGFVEVDRSGCVDLLDRTSIMESVWLLQRLPVVVCNDSSPLHMAVTGNAFIGFVTTAKHPDYIKHWRKNLNGVNEWGWRMQDFQLGGLWEILDNCPDSEEDKVADKCAPGLIKKWLPDPNLFGPWCRERRNEYYSKI